MKREIRYKFVIVTKYIEGGSFHTDYEELEDAKATYDDLKVRDDYEYFSIIKCSAFFKAVSFNSFASAIAFSNNDDIFGSPNRISPYK